MQFSEIISIVGYAIEAVGVFVLVIGSCLASVVFIRTFRGLPEGVAYRKRETGAVISSSASRG